VRDRETRRQEPFLHDDEEDVRAIYWLQFLTHLKFFIRFLMDGVLRMREKVV